MNVQAYMPNKVWQTEQDMNLKMLAKWLARQKNYTARIAGADMM